MLEALGQEPPPTVESASDDRGEDCRARSSARVREYPISRKLADELEPLLAADLENYLEQRVLYRRLVEASSIAA